MANEVSELLSPKACEGSAEGTISGEIPQRK